MTTIETLVLQLKSHCSFYIYIYIYIYTSPFIDHLESHQNGLTIAIDVNKFLFYFFIFVNGCEPICNLNKTISLLIPYQVVQLIYCAAKTNIS